MESDLSRLTEKLRRIASGVRPSADPAWSRPVAIRVVDCVLSLNRNYDCFVVPRIERLMKTHPELRSVVQLAILMSKYDNPATFVESELNYKHDDRACILEAVVRFVCGLVRGASADKEEAVLKRWAVATKPEVYRSLNIKGFKLAGFQYLRMLFGAQTTKPDKHIIAFVSDALSRQVSALEALELLEAASVRAHLSIRDVDTSIWETSARGAQS